MSTVLSKHLSIVLVIDESISRLRLYKGLPSTNIDQRSRHWIFRCPGKESENRGVGLYGIALCTDISPIQILTSLFSGSFPGRRVLGKESYPKSIGILHVLVELVDWEVPPGSPMILAFMGN